MAVVHCPCCEESVRLPVARLPEKTSIRCPWCSEQLPPGEWLAKLPPTAILLGADGESIDLEDLASQVPIERRASQAALAESIEADSRRLQISEIETDCSASDQLQELAACNVTNSLQDTVDLDEAVEDDSLDVPRASRINLDHQDTDDSDDDDDGDDIDGSDCTDKLSITQPTIEEIENAWDSHDASDSQESISEAVPPHNLDVVLVGEKSAGDERLIEWTNQSLRDRNRLHVTLAEDHRALDERTPRGKRAHSWTRLLKLAAPTLVAIPIMGAVLVHAGLDLDFYKLEGTSGSNTPTATQPPLDFSQTSKDNSEVAKATNSYSIAGRVLVGSDSSWKTEGPSKPSDSGQQHQTVSATDPDFGTASVEDVIQSLDGKGKELRADTNESSGVTIEAVARQQLEERDSGKQPPAPKDLSNDISGSLLVFPSVPPSVESVRRSIAEPAMVAELATDGHEEELPTSLSVGSPPPEFLATDPDITDPIVSEDKTTESSPWIAELATARPFVPSDSPEFIAACNRATRSLDKLKQTIQKDASPTTQLIAELSAFRDLSYVGGFLNDSKSPSLPEIFSTLTEGDILSRFAPLCGEWISWERRKTDGMLLIGTLHEHDNETMVELVDGSQIHVEVNQDHSIPVGMQCAMLGKIISADGRSLVQVFSGIALP